MVINNILPQVILPVFFFLFFVFLSSWFRLTFACFLATEETELLRAEVGRYRKVHVFVALCDNKYQVIRKVPAGIGPSTSRAGRTIVHERSESMTSPSIRSRSSYTPRIPGADMSRRSDNGTATDPAPLSMLETVITLKPKSQWRRVNNWYSGWAPEWLKGVLREVPAGIKMAYDLLSRRQPILGDRETSIDTALGR